MWTLNTLFWMSSFSGPADQRGDSEKNSCIVPWIYKYQSNYVLHLITLIQQRQSGHTAFFNFGKREGKKKKTSH
jgi:hypothetical protein